MRPELFVEGLRWFVNNEMGSYFTENLLISLEESFIESDAHIPLIFVLQPGDDPQDELKKFAAEKAKYITFVSLGKG
jgi:dynein heavy chain, axonemal